MQPYTLSFQRSQHHFQMCNAIPDAWVSNAGGAHLYTPARHWQILCWGDPAYAQNDASLLEQIITGKAGSQWGRSWLAYNRITQSVTGATDQLGLFPIFYFADGQQTLFTTARRGLVDAGVAIKMNPEHMRSLVAFGQLFNNDCLYENCQQFAGRSTFSWQEKTGLSQHSDQSPLLGEWHSNFDNALEAFVEAVRNSLQHQPQVLVSLSGGLDSRLILAATQALGKKVTGLSYGHPDSADARIARQLATLCNMPLFSARQRDQNMSWPLVQRVAKFGAGEVPLHHAHALIDQALLEQSSEFTLLTGTGAETARAFYYDRGMPGYSLLGQRHFQQPLMRRAQSYVEQEFLKTAAPFFNFASDWQSDMLNQLRQQIAKQLANFQTPALFLDNFYLQNRVPRMVGAGQQLLDSHYLRSHPFLQKDALFHMAHLPVRYKLGSNFHRLAIAKLAPNLADIEWDKTAQPLRQGLTWQRRYPALASRLGMNAWGKISSPMYRYDEVLQSVPSELLSRTLAHMQIDPETLNHSAWQQALAHQNLRSFSCVWSVLTQSKNLSLAHSA